MLVVSDSGPLIYLGTIGRLDPLNRLYDEVVVPVEVFGEVTVAEAC